jgi:hypothetical protein
MSQILIKPENAFHFIQENTPGYNPMKGSSPNLNPLDEDLILVNNAIVYGPNLSVQIQVNLQIPGASHNKKDKYVAAFNYTSEEYDSTSIKLRFKDIKLAKV